MRRFIDVYLDDLRGTRLDVLDVGSLQVAETMSSYRSLLECEHWNYTGLDLVRGPNVDLCIAEPYDWAEVGDNRFDVVVSGQTFEHIEFFWMSAFEIGRALREGGLACIIAPSSGPEHRHPTDCWRFYPDGLRAVCRYLGFRELDCFTRWGEGDWQDSVLVMQKPRMTDEQRSLFARRNAMQKAVVLPDRIPEPTIGSSNSGVIPSAIPDLRPRGLEADLASIASRRLPQGRARARRIVRDVIGPRAADRLMLARRRRRTPSSK